MVCIACAEAKPGLLCSGWYSTQPWQRDDEETHYGEPAAAASLRPGRNANQCAPTNCDDVPSSGAPNCDKDAGDGLGASTPAEGASDLLQSRSASRPSPEAAVVAQAPAAQSLAWSDHAMLRCSYAHAEQHGASVLSCCWVDACGELMHHEVWPADPAGQERAAAWLVAQLVLERTLHLLARCAAGDDDALSHVCIVLTTGMDEHAWAWAHVPELLAACEQAGSHIPHALSYITAALLVPGDASTDNQVRSASCSCIFRVFFVCVI